MITNEQKAANILAGRDINYQEETGFYPDLFSTVPIWTRYRSNCAWDLCSDKLIEAHSKVLRVKGKPKGHWWTRYYHLYCYPEWASEYLDKRPQKARIVKPGPGAVRKYNPEQIRVRRSLNTQLYNLMSKRRQAVSINADNWLKLLDADYTKLMERYDKEAGGKPKEYRGIAIN